MIHRQVISIPEAGQRSKGLPQLPEPACASLTGGQPRARPTRAAPRPHRLVDQDSALSRRQHGFESRWGYQTVNGPRNGI